MASITILAELAHEDRERLAAATVRVEYEEAEPVLDPEASPRVFKHLLLVDRIGNGLILIAEKQRMQPFRERGGIKADFLIGIAHEVDQKIVSGDRV